MNIDNDLKILETAKLLSNSSDIDRIIEVAKKIKQYLTPAEVRTDILQMNTTFSVQDFAVLSDIVSFAKACSIQHPVNGSIPFNPYPFQEDALRLLSENNHLTVLNTARQMGMTTIFAIFALFQAATKPDQAILICGNRLAHAIEIMDRIRFAYQSLPNNVRPGVIEYNKTTISFANGSRIMGRAVTEHAGRGLSLTHIMIDQAAYVSYKTLDGFWTSTMPCMATGGKTIVQSTPRYADGLFYDLCRNAPDNGAHLMTIPWHKHPERNEAWAEPYRQNLGERAWRSEFECEFILPESE
jgi:hypothetical protein